MVIGTELNHYKILRELGRGGMGAVYEAEDTKLGRHVALKVLPSELAGNPERLERFQREARAVAALNHPNIVVLHSVEEDGGTHFLTMELVEGKPLSNLVPEGGLPMDELVEHSVALAEAMGSAHNHGITHRDLKPANVMVNSEGRIKVLDFGLAKLTESASSEDDETQLMPTHLTGEGRIVGTIAHMAPEQAEGKEVDSRTDVFAFGVLVYQLATGHLPFEGDTSASTLAKILEAEPESPSALRANLPSDLERIIGRCLEKRPADRYNDTRDLVADLRSLQGSGEGQVAARSKTLSRSPVVWMVTLAVVALVAALVFVMMPRAGDDPEGSSEVVGVATKPSVAVLPFHDLSGDPENSYFSAGMTEEIISKLSRIEELEVASRGSVARYTDRERDPKQVASELGVAYLLDGSVRRAGDRVRVSAQLVDGSTARNVWSEDFDGSLEDVFSMQENAALEIARRLNLELSPAEQQDVGKRLTDNVAAYDAYLKGMSLYRGWGNPANFGPAVEQFELALELDPNFAAAMAGLAGVLGEIYRGQDSSEEVIQRAEELARRAVELDPNLADASNALAMVTANRWDYRRASELARETVRLAPKESLYWENLAWTLAYQTPPKAIAAEQAAREAIRLQSNYPGAYYQLGRALIAQGRHDEARVAFETSTELDPGFDTGHLGLAQYHLAVDAPEAALAELEITRSKKTALNFYYRAAAYALLADSDRAIADLESAFDVGFRDFAVLETSDYFASLRADPRYADLIRRFKE